MRLWSTTAVIAGLKTSLGIIIAWGIVLWLQWPEPFMAPVAVLVLQTPYLGASLRKGLMRVLGTLAGALLVLALIGLFVQERWPLLAMMSLVLMISVYQMRLSRYGYAWFMVALAVAVIAWDASGAPGEAFRAAVYRTSEAIIGILVVLVVNGVLWPRTAGHRYLEQQRWVLTALATHLRETGAAVTAGKASSFATMPNALLRAGPELRELLAAAEFDTGRFRQLHRTHEAQIQALTATLGSMMGLSENLRVAAAGRRAFLTAPQRQVLREALEQVAVAIESAPAAGPAPTSAVSPDSPSDSPPALSEQILASAASSRVQVETISAAAKTALAEAEQRRQRLLTGPSLAQQTGGDSALAHALAAQLQALTSTVQQLVEASTAVATGRTLSQSKLPPDPSPPWRHRFAVALPNALAMGLAFWVSVLSWMLFQWPPEGLLAVVMALVLIGGHTLQKTPLLQPAKLTLLGFLIGIIATAPIYLILMPQLDGFAQLALALFPIYFAIAYFMHALPPPHQLTFLRIGVLAIILLNLEPHQVYDATSYIDAALSAATGFLIGVAALVLVRSATPQEQLRRSIKRLLSLLSAAQQALADLDRSDIANVLARHEQQLRTEQQALSELLPACYSTRAPRNDRDRILALGDAVQGLVTRFRGLQRARVRWGVALRHQGLGTRLGRQLLKPLVSTYEAFKHKLDDPTMPASIVALDAIVHDVRTELTRIDAYQHDVPVNADAVYTLTIAGHYLAVIHALRDLAAALDDIDWAAWRRVHF